MYPEDVARPTQTSPHPFTSHSAELLVHFSICFLRILLAYSTFPQMVVVVVVVTSLMAAVVRLARDRTPPERVRRPVAGRICTTRPIPFPPRCPRWCASLTQVPHRLPFIISLRPLFPARAKSLSIYTTSSLLTHLQCFVNVQTHATRGSNRSQTTRCTAFRRLSSLPYRPSVPGTYP